MKMAAPLQSIQALRGCLGLGVLSPFAHVEESDDRSLDSRRPSTQHTTQHTHLARSIKGRAARRAQSDAMPVMCMCVCDGSAGVGTLV